MRANSDLEEILSQALAAMKAEEGSTFDIEHVNWRNLEDLQTFRGISFAESRSADFGLTAWPFR